MDTSTNSILRLNLLDGTTNVSHDMRTIFIFLVLLTAIVGCSPTVQLAAPKEPIEINLNIKIEHEIRIQVDRELEGLFDEESEIF